MTISQSIYIISIITREIGKLKTHSPTYCIMDSGENMPYLTHTLDKNISETFYKFTVFRQVCTMVIMRWCNVQRNEYDLQDKTYPIVCTHHKLHNNNENKFPVSRNVYAISSGIWYNKHLRHTTTEKYDNNGRGGHFRFDDDNNMSYRYILSITYTEHIQPYILKWK